MKKVMVLAGSKWQIPVIKKLKSMGYEVLDVNPYKDSPAFEFADEYELHDILDKEACLKCARLHSIDAVLSEECDIAMPTVAYVADALGLPSIGVTSATLYTDKYLMREFCRKNGLRFPEYKKCRTVEEAKEFLKTIGKKIIIKPLDANSSRGVFTIECESDLEKHFDESIGFSKSDKCIIAERYINGTEFTVDGIKTTKRHYTMAISEKKHYANNENVASELYFSHENDKYDYKKLIECNDKFINMSGLPYGLTHAEYKYEDGEFYLIEIAARGGGNLISSDIVPIMTGIDNYKYLIECSVNGAFERNFEVPEKYRSRCAVLKFLDVPGNGGIVEKIQGTEYLENNPNIPAWGLSFNEGDTIIPAKDDSARIGFYIAYADSRDELDGIMEKIHNELIITIK